ncbi:MAG: hypothetical protein M1839_001310, partial [Geoglossum umbratile]
NSHAGDVTFWSSIRIRAPTILRYPTHSAQASFETGPLLADVTAVTHGWDLYAEEGTTYVRCIRIGSDRNGTTNLYSRFYLDDEATVDVHFVDNVYTPPQSGDPQCFVNGSPQTSSGCYWNKISLTDPPTNRVRNTSTNIVLVEYSVPKFSPSYRTAWCDDIVYPGFQTYAIDPSPFSNFIHLAQLYFRVQFDTIPPVVDTYWILVIQQQRHH